MSTVEMRMAGSVAVVTLNRPERFNALDVPMARELAETLTRLSSDSSVRAVVLTGAGRAFCAGGDLRWAASHPQELSAAFHELASHVNACAIEIRRMNKAVIAALNGVAGGGGFSLALACDFRLMNSRAVLRQGYTSNGLCIDAGGTFLLPRIVGLARALEIAAFDEPIDSALALEWGLATRATSSDDVVADAIAMGEQLARRSVNAFAHVKALLTDGFETSFERQLEAERRGIAESAAHPDGVEGVTAFLEKREPAYQRNT